MGPTDQKTDTPSAEVHGGQGRRAHDALVTGQRAQHGSGGLRKDWERLQTFRRGSPVFPEEPLRGTGNDRGPVQAPAKQVLLRPDAVGATFSPTSRRPCPPAGGADGAGHVARVQEVGPRGW